MTEIKASFKSKLPWKKQSDILRESYAKIYDRKQGKIKSLKTRWKSFNKIGLNGIEWQSLIVIGARPGVGKSLIANTITRDIQELNKDQVFFVLHFQFEMLAANVGIRELSASTKLDVRYIQSAEDDGMPPLSREHLEKLKKYSESQDSRNEFVIDSAMTVNQMQSAMIKFYEHIGRKPVVITLDHTLLIKQAATERSKQETLQNLAVMLTDMKNRYPFTFIILSQLNRTIDESDRQKPGMLSNYPTDADIYGSDFLMQCADVMIAYNRPAKYNLSSYGPLKYVITPSDKFLLAMHVLKNRFGTVGIEWYKAEYAIMSVVEAEEPIKRGRFES